jgi:hypothetical protein
MSFLLILSCVIIMQAATTCSKEEHDDITLAVQEYETVQCIMHHYGHDICP